MNIDSSASAQIMSRPSGHVLVVDDESHVLAMACTMLESQGFEVTGCGTGEEALKLLAEDMQMERKYKVMVLDLTLPGGMSGFDVLEAVLNLEPQFAVIACSGYFQEDARDLCQAIGFADILQKPYSVEVFCAIVRRCLVREPLAACSHA